MVVSWRAEMRSSFRVVFMDSSHLWTRWILMVVFSHVVNVAAEVELFEFDSSVAEKRMVMMPWP